jgi:hypothetical protein
MSENKSSVTLGKGNPVREEVIRGRMKLRSDDDDIFNCNWVDTRWQ